jgi:hypothetical protein
MSNFLILTGREMRQVRCLYIYQYAADEAVINKQQEDNGRDRRDDKRGINIILYTFIRSAKLI